MPAEALHISLAIANQIFTCVATPPDAQAMLGILSKHADGLHFTAGDIDNEQPDGNTLQVYNHLPPPSLDGERFPTRRFLVVETGTKGVLEIKGYQQTKAGLKAFDIITQ